MKEQRIIAHRRLSQLEMEKAGIEHAIDEIQRRFALLDEVESWGLLVPDEPSPDYSLVLSQPNCWQDRDGEA